jgi:hypothetical protein
MAQQITCPGAGVDARLVLCSRRQAIPIHASARDEAIECSTRVRPCGLPIGEPREVAQHFKYRYFRRSKHAAGRISASDDLDASEALGGAPGDGDGG